jgi:hypothetical protein
MQEADRDVLRSSVAYTTTMTIVMINWHWSQSFVSRDMTTKMLATLALKELINPRHHQDNQPSMLAKVYSLHNELTIMVINHMWPGILLVSRRGSCLRGETNTTIASPFIFLVLFSFCGCVHPYCHKGSVLLERPSVIDIHSLYIK